MRKLVRIAVYLLGLMTLALGIVTAARTGLGVSAISSIPHTSARLTGLSPGFTTACLYAVCVLFQLILGGAKQGQWKLLLQLPFSVVFGMFIHLFDGPFNYQAEGPVMQIALMVCALMLTAMGSVLVMIADVVPNAPDGLARRIGELAGKDYGFGKSVVDFSCVGVTAAGTLLLTGHVMGIGIGTVASMLLVGRLASRFERLLRPRLTALMLGEAREDVALEPVE